MPKIIPLPRGFISTDVFFPRICNNMLLQGSNLSFRVFLEQQQHSFRPVFILTGIPFVNSSPYHTHLYFGFLDKSSMFYSQAQEGYPSVSLVQSPARNVTTSQGCHKRGISLKPWSRDEPRSEPQHQPIPYAPISNYSTFLV